MNIAMETEYIRGKTQERDGALTARPPASFSARGNDVWAHRSGRTYQPSLGGNMKDFSSPVTGNGKMGDLSRLVGGKKRRGSSVDSVSHMTPEEAHELVHRDYRGGNHPYLTKSGAVRAKYRGSGIWDDIKGIAGKVVHEFTDPQSKLRTEIAPTVAKYGKFLDYVPGLEGVGTAVSTAANFLSTEKEQPKPGPNADGTYVQPAGQQLSQGQHRRMRRKYRNSQPEFKGGAEHMMSPMEAKQLVMMDYRGGGHPYLTKAGAVRASLRGSGIWDSIKSLAVNAGKDFLKSGAKKAGDALADVASRGIQDRLNQAQAQANAPSQYMATGQVKVPKFSKSYGITAVPPPPARAPPVDRLEMIREEMRAKTARNRAMAESANYAKAQAAKARQMIDDYNEEDTPLRITDATEADLRDMKYQRHSNKISDLLGREVSWNPKRYEVGSGRRGGGTPDLPTLALLAQGAQRGGAKKRTNRRGQAVAKVMRERGVSLAEASKIVKAEGLA